MKKKIDFSDNISKVKTDASRKSERQQILDFLSNSCLNDSGVYNNYDIADLCNATVVFSHFLLDAMFTECKSMSIKKQLEMATLTGNAIRELILTATGKDMKEVIKTAYEK